jgi:IPT/TIG domain/PASTA domain
VRRLALLATLICAFAVPATAAQAATATVGQLGVPGQECGFGERNANSFAAPGYTVPIDGTIIEWSFQTGSIVPSSMAKMKVFSVSGNSYTVVGESIFGTLTAEAINTFDVEIPVKTGDILGLYTGSPGAGQCFVYVPVGAVEEQILLGDPLLGQTQNTNGTISQARFPMTAVVLPPPTVTAVDPVGGYSTGGTVVTMTGTDLQRVKSVTFGGVAATSFTEVGETTLRAVAPAAAVGTVDVRVTTAAGQSPTSAADQFTYASPPPPGDGGGGTTNPPAGGSGAPPVVPVATVTARTCKVPNLRNRKIAAARRAIRAAGCTVGKVTRARGVKASAARVRSQGPKAGTTVIAGTAVKIRLS